MHITGLVFFMDPYFEKHICEKKELAEVYIHYYPDRTVFFFIITDLIDIHF